jgi:hypothetical protein
LPNLLFRECKEWARNTNGQLYLTARRVESLDINEAEKSYVQPNYGELSFLDKLLEKSKILPNDQELLEFLRLAKNQTRIITTSSPKAGQPNLEFMLAVSTA